jgi:excisionase family DNA binding protein
MKVSNEQTELLGIVDTMKILNVSRATVYRLMGQGELRAVLINKRRLITRREINRFIAELEERADAA